MVRLLAVSIVIFAITANVSWARSTPMSGHHTPPDITGWREINEKAQNAKYKKYDENYEKGKAVYKGAGKHVKYQYCVPDINGETPVKRVPVKRRSMMAFREMSVIEFVKQLYDCENPDKWVLNYLEKEDAGYVVYYLNAHYELKLKQ